MRKEWVRSGEYRLRNILRKQGIEVVRRANFPRADSLLALHLDTLFSALKVDLVLDVGARIGEYGVWLRRNGFKGRIISFEPVSSNYAELSGRASQDDLWETVNVAVGSVDGEAEINVSKQTQFSSFLTPNEYALEVFHEGPEIDHIELVGVRRLDTVLPAMLGRGVPPNIYLKMDTQGWDFEVLRGATGVLGHIAALQSEVSVLQIYDRMPDFRESLDRFVELGFALSGMFPVTLDASHRVVEFDCVCVAGTTSAGP